jgi:hypothetical protein
MSGKQGNFIVYLALVAFVALGVIIALTGPHSAP